jgi:glucose/arabinose dehydrogenase
MASITSPLPTGVILLPPGEGPRTDAARYRLVSESERVREQQTAHAEISRISRNSRHLIVLDSCEHYLFSADRFVAIDVLAAVRDSGRSEFARPVQAVGQQSGSELADPFEVGVRLVAAGLTSPIGIVSAFDGSGWLFIIDQTGVIRILTRDGQLLTEPFLDVRSKVVALRAFDERGLLGLAFHPDYESNGRFFVYYNAPPRTAGFDNTATFSEFHVSSDPTKADPHSERVFLQLDDPQFNHNGGTLAFGPDGFLYMSIGDGGAANDCAPGHVEDWYADNCGGNGQDVEQNLFGNILRIDVDGTAAYGIPADNPFVGIPGLDEIYAYGFRNPYRFSFDMANGRLFVGDAGQGSGRKSASSTRAATTGGT